MNFSITSEPDAQFLCIGLGVTVIDAVLFPIDVCV